MGAHGATTLVKVQGQFPEFHQKLVGANSPYLALWRSSSVSGEKKPTQTLLRAHRTS